MASQIDLGAVVPIGKGDWNSSTTYERTNIVRHNSTAWMCKVATSTGVEPSKDSSDWYLLVKDTSSVTSVNGMKGDVVVDTSTADKLTTARKITLTGPITGTANFDGSTDINIPTTIVEASTSTKGVVQLSSDINSTSTAMAATASAVKIAYDKAVAAEAAIANALPVGALLPSFASSMSGCLLCNSAAVSRITYANLFALLGTSFGAGDGSTTFNLPDFRNKTLWGANGNLMAAIAAGLPNITGKISQGVQAGGSDSGAFYRNNTITGVFSWAETSQQSLNFDASRSNKIYGNSTTVQPPAIAVNIFIKY